MIWSAVVEGGQVEGGHVDDRAAARLERPDEDPPARSVSTPGERIHALDALRGFALGGIHIVNIYQQLVFAGTGSVGELPAFVRLAFYERFLTIFSILFGVGFALFLERASARTSRPRVVLARRLAVLLLIGAVHFVFHPGEVLTAYAIGGLVVLLPLSLLGGRAALAVALVLLVLGAQVVAGYGIIPGLLALGYALAVLGVPEALERRTGRVAVAFAVFGTLAVGYTVAVVSGVELPWVNFIGGLGGGVSLVGPAAAIATALAYSCGFLLLLGTRLAPAISGIFAPMGRMALTNYLSATALLLLGGALLGIDSPGDLPQIVGLTLGIVLVQIAWSRRWFRTFRYGPVEWMWRCCTWLQLAPIRR
jgi:uncharacterized protein